MRKGFVFRFQHMDEQRAYIDVFQSARRENAMIRDHMCLMVGHELPGA